MALNRYPAFNAIRTAALGEIIEEHLGARILRLESDRQRIDARANRYSLTAGELWFCSYSLPITLRFQESEDIRIQIPRRGAGSTRIAGDLIPVTRGGACIHSVQADVNFGDGYEQVAWRVSRRKLTSCLASLTDQAVVRPIEFDRKCDLALSQSLVFAQIFDSLIYSIDHCSPSATRLLIPELENALVTSLLTSIPHNYSRSFEAPAQQIAPWQVNRAENFIESNWDRPLDLNELVAVTGASARSIFRTFKITRGYTPFQFAKKIRLQHARQLLESAEGQTVTEVAMACGFENLSRFSKDFADAYGQPPSKLTKIRKKIDAP